MDERAKNQRLIRTYGITLVDYNQMLVAQNGVCAICRRPPRTRALNVDHDHKLVRTRILAGQNVMGLWTARADLRGSSIAEKFSGNRKKAAVQQVLRWLKKKSVRGLLCGRCNRGIQFFNDNQTTLAAAAEYLRRFHGEGPPRD